MKVYVVTVTYGDRFNFLKEVIDNALNEGVDKVIVVDNASSENSRNQLKEYEQKNKNKTEVVYLDENIGSASGFKIGIEKAYKDNDCGFIWLLDDDNKPEKGSLNAVKEFWKSLNEKDKETNTALLSYRFKKEKFVVEAIQKNKPEHIIGIKNSFYGFHVKELPKKIYRYVKRNLKQNKDVKINIKYGVVSVAPYGGLFFHKKLIDKIGLPKEELYLYSDDHEWSYRITNNGGKIFLVLDSKIDDIDLSWHITKNPKDTSFSVVARGDTKRVYYSIRNRVFFEKKYLVDNKIIWFLNMIIFVLLLGLISRKNLRYVLKAIKDGYTENLGKKELET